MGRMASKIGPACGMVVLLSMQTRLLDEGVAPEPSPSIVSTDIHT